MSEGRSKGFTLFEVLIAMAIMSMIVTVIYASFSTAGRNVENAEASRDAMDLARTLVEKLAGEIANAYVEPGMNYPDVTTIFYGEMEEAESGDERTRRDSLTLTSLTNWRKPDSKETDIWEIGYFFKQKPDGSGYSLMRREKRELGKNAPALEGGAEYEISDRVGKLQFRYYDDQGRSWRENWDSRSRGANPLPRAVEITLVLNEGPTVVTEIEVGR